MQQKPVDFVGLWSASSAQMFSPPRTRILLGCLLSGVLGALVACGEQAAGECQIDSDCSSGRCGENGQCNTDGLADAGDELDGAADAQVSACGQEVDDTIVRAELPMQAGVKGNFRVASGATFDTAGETLDGQRLWNLDQNFANDFDIEVELFETQGAWYQDVFTSASYAAELGQDTGLLGVFRLADDGLFLLGVVSPEDGLTRTELSYDPPALMMPIPLREGDTWMSDSVVSGLAQGFFSNYSEVYQGEADASGTLITPFGSFRVIRNRVQLERTVGFVITKTTQFNFVSECAGIVGSIASNEGEEGEDFSEVAELRRLIP